MMSMHVGRSGDTSVSLCGHCCALGSVVCHLATAEVKLMPFVACWLIPLDKRPGTSTTTGCLFDVRIFHLNAPSYRNSISHDVMSR